MNPDEIDVPSAENRSIPSSVRKAGAEARAAEARADLLEDYPDAREGTVTVDRDYLWALEVKAGVRDATRGEYREARDILDGAEPVPEADR